MPPEANAACVCAREETLEGSQRPYDAQRPRVCLDAGTKHVVQAGRTPLPAAPGRLDRIAYAYERQGTGNLCMRCEPLAGRREGLGTARRTAVDDAEAIQPLVDVSSPRAEQIVLMQDNLNTHTRAALSEAFPPEDARRLSNKLEGHDTPKHGRWLHMADSALGVVRGQCLDRRLPDFPT